MTVAAIKSHMPIHITYSGVANSHQLESAPIPAMVSAKEVWRGVMEVGFVMTLMRFRQRYIRRCHIDFRHGSVFMPARATTLPIYRCLGVFLDLSSSWNRPRASKGRARA